MSEQIETHNILPIPRTEQQIFRQLQPFSLSLAKAIGATVLLDGVITCSEYQALSQATTALGTLSQHPGLISALVLQSIIQPHDYSSSISQLKKTARAVSDEKKLLCLQAIVPIIAIQPCDMATKVLDDWTDALSISAQVREEILSAISVNSGDKEGSEKSGFFGKFRFLRMRKKKTNLQKAEELADTFQDEELMKFVHELKASGDMLEEQALAIDVEIQKAAQRANSYARNNLKSAIVLRQQIEVSERFYNTSEALLEQVQSRLESIRDRFELQADIFDEDLRGFVDASLDSIEISMRNLMVGREDWEDPTYWEQFSKHSAYADLLSKFQPLKNKYERIFALWNKELQSFSKEVVHIRTTVLQNIDPQALSSLIPTNHKNVGLKNTIDKAADATLGVAALGVAGTVGAVAVGVLQASAAVAIVANPVGAVVGVAALSAATWKLFANKEARKRKLLQDKKDKIRVGLVNLLKNEAFNHDQIAQDIMEKFLQTAEEQYAPLIIDARMALLKAKLEEQVVSQIFETTRNAFLLDS